jgi:hypothetical protein
MDLEVSAPAACIAYNPCAISYSAPSVMENLLFFYVDGETKRAFGPKVGQYNLNNNHQTINRGGVFTFVRFFYCCGTAKYMIKCMTMCVCYAQTLPNVGASATSIIMKTGEFTIRMEDPTNSANDATSTTKIKLFPPNAIRIQQPVENTYVVTDTTVDIKFDLQQNVAELLPSVKLEYSLVQGTWVEIAVIAVQPIQTEVTYAWDTTGIAASETVYVRISSTYLVYFDRFCPGIFG